MLWGFKSLALTLNKPKTKTEYDTRLRGVVYIQLCGAQSCRHAGFFWAYLFAVNKKNRKKEENPFWFNLILT